MGIKRIVYFLTATLALLFFSFAARGEGRPFITKWKGEAGKELKIPIWGKNYKLVIKKASDNTVLKTETSLTITSDDKFYQFTPTEDGELLVEAGPEGVETFYFFEKEKEFAEVLLEVQQFGGVLWSSDMCFRNCKNMKFATGIDIPDLTKAGYVGFEECIAFNFDLSSWDVSNCYGVNLSHSGISTENYSKSLVGWAGSAQGRKNLYAAGLQFNTSAKEARDKLIYEQHWFIKDDCPVGGKKYDLQIGRLQLNTDNTQNLTHSLQQMGILKRGAIHYEHTEKEVILTLEDVELLARDSTQNTINGEDAIWYYQESGNLKLKIKGGCKVVGAIISSCDLSVLGGSENDKLAVRDGFGWALGATGNLQISNCSLNLYGAVAIGSEVGTVLIDNANIRANGCDISIVSVGSGIVLKGCLLVKPKGAYIGKGKWYDEDVVAVLDQKGEPVKTDWVEILKKSSPDNAVEDPIFASVIVSPNPFETQLRISNGDVRGRYALYNTQGVEVASGVLECAETLINTTSFPAGMYLLRLTAEKGATKTFTVVKR